MELLTGYWWLPSRKAKKLAGTLTLQDDGKYALELLGMLCVWHDDAALHLGEPIPLILGAVESGELITLADCQYVRIAAGPLIKGPRRTQGRLLQGFTAATLLRGAHFEQPGHICFHELEVEYTRFPYWASAPRFDTRRVDAGVEGRTRQVFVYTSPRSVTGTNSWGEFTVQYSFQSDLDNELDYELAGLSSLLRDRQSVSMHQSAALQIRLPESLSLEHCLTKYVFPIRDLLTLATGAENGIGSLTASSTQSVNPSLGIWRPSGRLSIQTSDLRHESDMAIDHYNRSLFSLDDIADEFAEVLGKWLDFSQEFASVCKLFFGAERRGQVYSEPTFLSLVRAAESYHRRRFGERMILRDRLRMLVDRTAELLPSHSFHDDGFLQRVVATRNYLTHDDDRLLPMTAHGGELKRMTVALRDVMKACLLLELGFPDARCAQMLGSGTR